MDKRALILKRTAAKASFTVEAAVIVPIAAIVLALLLGFIFYTHETIRAEAISYEAEFYGSQVTVDKKEPELMIKEHLAACEKESSLGFGSFDYEVSAGGSLYLVTLKGTILQEAFHDAFSMEKKVSIRDPKPVFYKRLIWTGGRIINS